VGYAQAFAHDLERIGALIKPENRWNIEQGLKFEARGLLASMDAQETVFHNASHFMQDYDLLVCPPSIVAPIPLEERYLGYSNGLDVAHYYRWLTIAYRISVTTLPVITLPCGKTERGLPVEMQLIGKAHGDIELMAHVVYIEQIFDWDPLQQINRYSGRNG